MTPEQVIQQWKNEALNKIRAIYHPLAKNHYDNYGDESYREQDSHRVQYIIECLEAKILNFKKEQREAKKTTV